MLSFYANRYASILYRYSQRFLTDALRQKKLPLRRWEKVIGESAPYFPRFLIW